MNHVEITLYINELRLRAVEEALAREGKSVEEKLKEHFAFLYEEIVPAEQQLCIEAEIEKNDAAEKAEAEARRRFGVFRIHENGESSFFTSELFQTLMASAYRYRLYEKGVLSSDPASFAEGLGNVEYISEAEYEELCDRMPNDHRIMLLADFDLDEGIASACQSSDNAWWTYSLKDLSTAAFRAFRGYNKSTQERSDIFENSLVGKELSVSDESSNETEESDEDEAPVMHM